MAGSYLRAQIKELKALRNRANSRRATQPVSIQGLESVRHKVADPLTWLQNFTKTRDPHWREAGARSPLRPFPDKPYFRPLIEVLQREETLFIAKSRDVMASWLCVGFFAHQAMITSGVEVLFQSQTEEKAAELVKYARILYENQDEDIKAQYPLPVPLGRQNQLELDFGHGSRIVGIPHGMDKIRSYHPTMLLIDEAAFVHDAAQSYEEAISACKKIVVLSSAAPGWFESVVVSAEDGPRKQLVTGVTEMRTPQGLAVLRVHYSADPERAKPDWKQRERPKYISESAWQAEQEIVFSTGGGEPLFADLLIRYADKILIDPESGFEPDPNWTYFAGFDAGKANPTAALVGCMDYEGNIYILREYYQPGLSPKEHAPWLRSLQGFVENTVYADPSIFYDTHAQNDGRFKALASLYRDEGIDNLVQAFDNNELRGMELILERWMNLDQQPARLKIVCPLRSRDIARPQFGLHNLGAPNLLWELRRARRAQLSPLQLVNRNPTEKIVDKDNHLRDCLKYMLLAQLAPPEKSWQQRAMQRMAPLVKNGDLFSAMDMYRRMEAAAKKDLQPRRRPRGCLSRYPHYR